jgi:hypothetical protein
MGKQTIEGPKGHYGHLKTFEVPMVQNSIMLNKTMHLINLRRY